MPLTLLERNYGAIVASEITNYAFRGPSLIWFILDYGMGE